MRQAIENEDGGAFPLTPAFLECIVRKLIGNLDNAVVPSTTSHEDAAAQDYLTQRLSVLRRQPAHSTESASPMGYPLRVPEPF
ncbi:hypothetical protein OVA06_13080 [Pseudarthrobacter sp. SL88]|uniref:hypothetical protein n=1 Tax=Pseudarthrobacter sp. SL88 TaxID=2994666 RepID=UPI0022740925|nr:hypothetical protein [Pseudarthrobacter sp. SL88]MCY1675629.1 hypothetical protein [Pseudarthrobacter sp. SL88]